MFLRTSLIGISVSLITTIIVTVGGGIIAGGFGAQDFVWVFGVSVVPIVASCVAIGLVRRKVAPTERNTWITAAIVSFLAVTLSGAIGAPIIQSMQFGIERVNVGGYIKWAPIYGLTLLPLSVPLTYIVTKVIWRPETIAKFFKAL